MAGVGDLVANLAVNNSQWTSGLNKSRGELTSFTSHATGLIAKIGVSLAGIWGVRASLEGFQSALDQSRKLNSVLAATGGAAGLTGQQISDYAAELQKVTNFEDDATVGAAALLAGFKNIKGDIFKETLAAGMDIAAIRGGDLSEKMLLLGRALDNPANGMARLAKAGISFSESQKAQIKSLQESGDLLGAQRVILDNISGSFGGAAETMANPLTQLKNTIGDVAENIGSLMVPALSVGAEAMREYLGIVVGGADAFKDLGIEAAVNLSHITGLVQLAALEWNIAFVEFVPNGEAVFQRVGAFINATWEASKVSFDLWVKNWLDGLTIVKNFSEAVFESIGAGLVALMSGENPFTAMADAWEQTVKAQFSPDNAQHFALGFAETFSETFAASMQGFAEGGGVADQLKKERDKLAASLGESMQTQREKLQKKFSPNRVAPAPPLDEDDSKKKITNKFGKDNLEKVVKDSVNLKSSLLGTSEAAAIMTRGLGGPGGNPMERIGNQQLDEQKRTTAAVKDLKKPVGVKEKPLFFDEPVKPKPKEAPLGLIPAGMVRPIQLPNLGDKPLSAPLQQGDPGFDAAVKRGQEMMAEHERAGLTSPKPPGVPALLEMDPVPPVTPPEKPGGLIPPGMVRPIQLPNNNKAIEEPLKQLVVEMKKNTAAVEKNKPQTMSIGVV